MVFLILVGEAIYLIKKRNKSSSSPPPNVVSSMTQQVASSQNGLPNTSVTVTSTPAKKFPLKFVIPLFLIVVIGSVVFLASSFLTKKEPQQDSRGRASGDCYEGFDCDKSDVTVDCSADQQGTVVETKLIVHKFSDEATCRDSDPWPLVGNPGLPGDPAGSCTANQRSSDGERYFCSKTASIPSCSVVQLDCLTTSSGVGPGGSIGFNCGGCNPPPTNPPNPTTPLLRCKNLTIPGLNTISAGGEKKTLNLAAEDGQSPYTWSVDIQTNKGQKGSVAITNNGGLTGQAEWTAPATPQSGQTWTFIATVTDHTGKSDSDAACQKTVSYTAVPPTATPTGIPPTATPTTVGPSLTPTATVPPNASVTPIPICTAIKFYSVNTTASPPNLFVKQLTVADLKKLKAGDKVTVTILGNQNTLKGQYRVKEGQKALGAYRELSLKRPGTNEFYSNTPYTIPSGTMGFRFEGRTQ